MQICYSEHDFLAALEEVRLVTIVGLGGTGKTRLMLEVAAGLTPDRFKWGLASRFKPLALTMAGGYGVRLFGIVDIPNITVNRPPMPAFITFTEAALGSAARGPMLTTANAVCGAPGLSTSTTRAPRHRADSVARLRSFRAAAPSARLISASTA